ncbi:hypothetical protein Plhal304r1_c036g0110841 [Plasmopara halstedii]
MAVDIIKIAKTSSAFLRSEIAEYISTRFSVMSRVHDTMANRRKVQNRVSIPWTGKAHTNIFVEKRVNLSTARLPLMQCLSSTMLCSVYAP